MALPAKQAANGGYNRYIEKRFYDVRSKNPFYTSF